MQLVHQRLGGHLQRFHRSGRRELHRAGVLLPHRQGCGQRPADLHHERPRQSTDGGSVGNRRQEEEEEPQREVAQANGYPDLKLRVEQKAPATSGYTAFSRGATYTRGTRD